jgi:hypothetical protein|tara:strand:+ start:993 stop:1190 length:198 start_codon:yes stop_codon:yes gene_type:complete
MKLGDALVLAKTKVESVDQVRNLNLWGNGLTDVEVRARARRVRRRARVRFSNSSRLVPPPSPRVA